MLVKVARAQWIVIEPADVFWLEAEGATTWIRLRGKQRYQDIRPLGEVVAQLAHYGFLRVHRNHAVNLRRIAEIRRRAKGQDWELKLEPPVNRVLAVSRSELAALWHAFGSR